MAITAAEVNKLRQMTGSGMMDCKNALVEAEGDFDKAIDILRKKGQKIAAKRADRTASDGYVYAQVSADKTFGTVVMVNCETDFVAKTEDFIGFAKQISDFSIANKIQDLQKLLDAQIEGRTVAQLLTDMTAKTGEKVELNRYEVINQPFVSCYNHNGNRLAVIVGFDKACEGLDVTGHEIAMQIAAMSPIAVDEASVAQEVIDHEIEIGKEQAINEGKPAEMAEKIARGRLNKFFKENTLMNQEFVKDNKKTIAQYLKETDASVKCTGFFRLQLGE